MTTPRVSDPKDQAPRPPEAANSDREVGTRGRQDDYEIKGWLGDQICGDGSSELPVGGVREIWGWTRGWTFERSKRPDTKGEVMEKRPFLSKASTKL